MQNLFKKFVTRLLELQARRLLKKFKPKVIAVTGSVGKTSTKLAIATVLSERYRVLAHYGSYNVPVAIPMAMFNMHLPLKLRSPLSWLKVYNQMEKQLHRPFPYDVLVLELGTDHPGEIAYFKRYLKPDIAVVTAVAPEHMQGFGSLDDVAKEELAVASYSQLTLINRNDVDVSYAKYVPEGINLDTYGTTGVAEYRFVTENMVPGKGFKGKFVAPEIGERPLAVQVIGEHNIRSVVAAGTVGLKLGMTADEVLRGMANVQPVNGRMNLLRGLRDSQLIDDTYNASPLAVVAALQTLYLFPTNQRIAILGSMNELGGYSRQAHEEVGAACDPALLSWIVTIGQDAKDYLAPAASAKGCQVRSFMSPYDAGAFVHSVLEQNAVVLAKGSQNGVFAEEALKVLLHSPEEEENLVRQTPDWLEIKQKQFSKF